jgi:hypothetical protein
LLRLVRNCESCAAVNTTSGLIIIAV